MGGAFTGSHFNMQSRIAWHDKHNDKIYNKLTLWKKIKIKLKIDPPVEKIIIQGLLTNRAMYK